MRLATNTPLDKLLEGGIESDAITNVYGPPGSGKTNIALSATLSCIRSGKKVVYVDTEGSFSLDRFEQIGGSEEDLNSIIFVNVHEWGEQHRDIGKLDKIAGDVGLIAVDSMVALYRLEMDEKNFPLINKQLATQYSVLSKITRTKHIPVIITNHIYSSGEGAVELTSRTIARYWSKTLVELKRTEKDNQRLAIVRKHRSIPEGRSIEFLITKDGLKQVGRFSIL